MNVTTRLLALSSFLLVCLLRAQTNWPGYIDTNFTATCITNFLYDNTVKGLLVQSDGKIVAVGEFANSASITNRACQNGIMRCDSNGVPDETFHSPFTVLPNFRGVTAAPGNKYLVAGSVFINGKQYNLARVNSNGALDATFTLTQLNPAGSSYAQALGLDTLNRPVIVGTTFATSNSLFVRRFDTNGAADATFAAPAILSWAGLGITSLAIQPDNKIIIGGVITNVGGTARMGIARLNTNGTLDTNFNSPFGALPSVAGIKLLPNGQMLVTGQFGTNANPNLILARLNTNGSIDSTFPPVPISAYGAVSGTALALQSDSQIIVTYEGVNGGVGRISASGIVDTNYSRRAGTIANGSFKSVAIDDAGRALVGGPFATLGPITRRGLTRLIGGNPPIPTPPTIEAQPTDQYAFVGGSATFSVGVSGTGPLIYNWYFGGANVGGGATVQFGPPLILGYDNTSIYCIITNQYGRATSSIVKLFVSPAPIAPTITTNPISVAVSNPAPISASDLTEANLRGKILHLHILGGATPFPVTGDYDIVLAAGGNTYAIPAGGAMAASSGNWTFGADLGIDTVITLDNSFPGGGPVKVALLIDGTYEMYADGGVNNQNGTYALFNSDGTPVGPTVSFTTAATGTEPFTYTWLFNGSPIAPVPDVPPGVGKAAPAGDVQGAGTATLTIRNATTLNAGSYYAIITNIVGSATSALATLTVNGFSGGVTDSGKPSLTITAPSAKLKTVGSNQVNFAGTAKDNIALAAVQVSVNAGSFFSAVGLSNWTANVPLIPGTNNIRIRAVDLLGNAVTNTRTLIYQPVIPLAGTYNGLFYDPIDWSNPGAGGVSLTLKTDSTYKGNVKQGASSYSFSGRFNLGLTSTSSVPRKGLTPLAVTLHFSSNRVEGTIADGTNWNSFLSSVKAGSVGTLAGKYSLLLPGSADPTNQPAGAGSDALTLTSKGRLSGLGTLADGSSVNIITTVAPGGQTPVYVSLYGGKGSLLGWLYFADDPLNDILGTLLWTKLNTTGGTLYTNGFSLGTFAAGSRFVAPPRNTPALTLTNGYVNLHGGNLTNDLNIPIVIGNDNKITGSNGLSLTISTLKGTITGSFIDPATGAKRTIKGVILRDQNYGGGEFLGPTQSGAIYIGNGP